MSSSFPHYSALAATLNAAPSTSPNAHTTYANNLEALIARAQAHPYPRAQEDDHSPAPAIGAFTSRRGSRRQSESVVEDEETMLFQTDDIPPAGGVSGNGKGKHRTMSYGAVDHDRRRRQSAGSSRSLGGARGRFRAEMGLSSTINGGIQGDHHRGNSDATNRTAGDDDEIRSIRTVHTIRDTVLGVLEPQLLLAEQGGETADEEEERILGHLAGGDLDEDHKDWKKALKVSHTRPGQLKNSKLASRRALVDARQEHSRRTSYAKG